MKSYEQDLQRAITSSQIIQKSVLQHFLDKNLEFEKESKLFDLALNPLVTLPTEGKAAYLTVFNSLTRQKEELISFLIETSKYETICVQDKDNALLKHQVSPYFNRSVCVYILTSVLVKLLTYFLVSKGTTGFTSNTLLIP